MTNSSDLMYTCSLIEFIGREKLIRRSDVVAVLGKEGIRRILLSADVLHSENIEAVADEFCKLYNIFGGEYDNVGACRYEVPSYWTIGQVFSRLILDVASGDMVASIIEVYTSWICEAISNYNSDLFYQSREYLKECYLAGEILAA